MSKLTGTKFTLSDDFVVTRSTISIASPVNVRAFGAKGDGVTDDTASIAAAIQAASNGVVLFPHGMVCIVQSQLIISSPVKIVGYGAEIKESAAFSGSNLIRVAAQNVTIEGLAITGLSTGKTGVTVTAGSADNLTVRNCVVSGCGYGLVGNSNNNVLFEGNHVHSCSLYGIWCQNIATSANLTGVTIRNNRVDTSHLDASTSTSLCVLVRGGDAYPTRNVKITGNTLTMPSNPSNSSALGCEMRSIDGGVFSGNYSLNGAMLVSATLCKNVSIADNSCESATFYGIEIVGGSGVTCEDIAVTGNVIDGGGILNYGIGLQGSAASRRIVVANNTIRSTTLYGIFINNQHDDVVVAGNHVYMDTADSAYGIYALAATGTIENLSIANNVLLGTSTALKAMFLDDIGSASITGNVCVGWLENGVLLRTESGTLDNVAIVGNAFVSANSSVTKTGAGTFGDNIVVYSNAGVRPSGTAGANYRNFAGVVMDAWGASSPEGAVAAGIGSTFMRTDGGANTTLYVKESGTGDTGWVAK